MEMEALHEVQAAALLGYRRMSEFRRAVRQGVVPAPDRFLRKGRRDPVWSRSRLEAWLKGDLTALSQSEEAEEAIRRAQLGHCAR